MRYRNLWLGLGLMSALTVGCEGENSEAAPSTCEQICVHLEACEIPNCLNNCLIEPPAPDCATCLTETNMCGFDCAEVCEPVGEGGAGGVGGQGGTGGVGGQGGMGGLGEGGMGGLGEGGMGGLGEGGMGGMVEPPSNRAPTVDLTLVMPSFRGRCVIEVYTNAIDPDGDDLTYRWTWNGEPIEFDGPAFQITAGRAAEFKLEVVVEDTQGAQVRDALDVRLPHCTYVDGMVVSPDGRSAYYRLDSGQQFDAFLAMTGENFANLLTINDAQEQAFLVEEFGRGPYWMGMRWNDRRELVWLNGQPSSFRAWCPGEPGGNEPVAEFGFRDDGCWNDTNSTRTDRQAILELPLGGGPEDLWFGGAFERDGFVRGSADHSRLFNYEEKVYHARISDGEGGCDGIGSARLEARFSGRVLGSATNGLGLPCPIFEFRAPAGLIDFVTTEQDGGSLNAHTIHVIPETVEQAQGEPCADEGERCSFEGVRTVFYGNGETWATRFARDGVDCTNAEWGDPVPGQPKQCFVAP